MTTTASTYSTVILNEVLNDAALKALTPKVVAWNHINQDSIEGAASLSKEYPVQADLGAAAAATEGSDFSTVTTLSYASAVTVTPTEAAVARADITTRAMRRKFPGMSTDQVFGAIMGGDYSMIVDLLEEEASRLAGMIYEKAETDVIALLDDFTDTAGSSGVDIDVSVFLTALYKLEENEPEHENFVALLDIEQIRTLRADLTSNGSNADGIVWNTQADASVVNFLADGARNGYKGSLLGVPMFQLAPSLRLTANAGADVVGSLVCRGEGVPGMPGSLNGAAVFVEGHPIRYLVDVDASKRMIELIGIWEYGVAELRDAHGVSIITDAP
jgi:hypothetical protein